MYAKHLLKEHKDGTLRPVLGFTPMYLRWAHSCPGSPEISATINPRMGRHCDIGRILDPVEAEWIGDYIPDEAKDAPDPLDIVALTKRKVGYKETVLHLETEIEPASRGNLVPPGMYQLHLRIGAANAKTIEKRLAVNLTGDWFNEREEMLTKGIVIREL